MRGTLVLATMALAAVSAAAPASAAGFYKVGTAGGGVSMKTEQGVRVWRAARSVDLELAGPARSAAPSDAQTLVVVEIVAPTRWRASSQGFWSGDSAHSRRYTQGVYSGAPVRRGRTFLRIYRRPL